MEGAVDGAVGNSQFSRAEEAGADDDQLFFMELIGRAGHGRRAEEEKQEQFRDDIQPGNLMHMIDVPYGHGRIAQQTDAKRSVNDHVGAVDLGLISENLFFFHRNSFAAQKNRQEYKTILHQMSE